jgi:cellobiose-specific phosphotransferase system component IIA
MKYLSIPVTSADNLILKADSIVTALRGATDTTTDLIIQGGTGTETAGQKLQLTHASDTATASVAKSIMDAVVAIHDNAKRPDVTYVVTPAQAVSAVAVA